MAFTAADVLREAHAWVGTPYVHQGRSRHGVDCIGFVICVRAAVEPLPPLFSETRNYARAPKNGLLLERVTHWCTPLTAVEDGCLVLIKWPLSAVPSHVGIYGAGNILHAYQRVGRVIETGYRAHWLRDTHSFWRLPGMAIP